MTPAELQTLLATAFPEAEVAVASPDGVHFSARIVDNGFSGLSRIARHQRVYAVLGERMGGEIHALSLETFAPKEVLARTPAKSPSAGLRRVGRKARVRRKGDSLSSVRNAANGPAQTRPQGAPEKPVRGVASACRRWLRRRVRALRTGFSGGSE